MAENKVFESIMNGLSESLAYAKGDTSKARKMSVTVAELPQYHDKEIKQIPKTNIQIGAMILRNHINNYNGNII